MQSTPSTRRVLRGRTRLALLQRELGLTVLHVTHDAAEVAALASRTLRLAGGRLAVERA